MAEHDLITKLRVRRRAQSRYVGVGVPDDAQPGDLVVGNRGAAAMVKSNERNDVIYLDYVGNYYEGAQPIPGRRMYDFR